MLIASTGMYYLENEAQPDKFSSVPESMYWAITTLTTVGYGDVSPITPLGKVWAGADHGHGAVHSGAARRHHLVGLRAGGGPARFRRQLVADVAHSAARRTRHHRGRGRHAAAARQQRAGRR